MLFLGIDDAGRGPAIGPMVLAGVLIEEKDKSKFIKLGIKDSKALLPKKREELTKIVKEKVIEHFHVIVTVDEIDSEKKDGLNLNQREAIAAAQIINEIHKRTKNKKIEVIIDCPSVNIESWKKYLEEFLMARSELKIICEHKADTNHVVVSAASILAKSIREEEVAKLKKKIGADFGSGYAADPTTRRFIYENYDKFKNKGVFRESWSTIKKHRDYKKQKKLFD